MKVCAILLGLTMLSVQVVSIKEGCMLWNIKEHSLIFSCGINNILEPLTLYDNRGKENSKCSFHRPANQTISCSHRHTSLKATVDVEKLEVSFKVNNIKLKDIDGSWTCVQGRRNLTSNVSKSKGIIVDTKVFLKGELYSINKSKRIKLRCSSCREPRGHNVEFLINNRTELSITFDSDEGKCIYAQKICHPDICYCSTTMNEFHATFALPSDNYSMFACNMLFVDKKTSKFFSKTAHLGFNGKDFQVIDQETEIHRHSNIDVGRQNTSTPTRKHDPETTPSTVTPPKVIEDTPNTSTRNLTKWILITIFSTVMVLAAIISVVYYCHVKKHISGNTQKDEAACLLNVTDGQNDNCEGNTQKDEAASLRNVTDGQNDNFEGNTQNDEAHCLRNETDGQNDNCKSNTQNDEAHCLQNETDGQNDNCKGNTQNDEAHSLLNEKDGQNDNCKGPILTDEAKTSIDKGPVFTDEVQTSVDKVKENKKLEDRSNSRVTKHCYSCSAHEGQKANTAMYRCLECGYYVCTKCNGIHRALSDHTSVEIDRLPKNLNLLIFCSKHKQQKLDYCCVDHDKLCCLECKQVYHSKCVKTEHIDVLAKDCKDSKSFIDYRNQLDFCSNALTNTKVLVKDNIESIGRNSEQIKNTIGSSRDNKTVEAEYELQLKENLKRMTQECLSTLQKHISDAEEMEANTENLDRLFDFYGKTGSQKVLFRFIQSTKSDLSDTYKQTRALNENFQRLYIHYRVQEDEISAVGGRIEVSKKKYPR